MRVTQTMVAANTLRNLSNNYAMLGKYQDEISSGKKITKPSDDPVNAVNGMIYTSQLNSIDQYNRNITTLQTWTSNSDSALQQANSDLLRIRELVVQGMNGTLNATDEKASADEIQQIKQDLANTANTQVAGKYIFHGTDVTNPPATINADGTVSVAANLNDPSISNFSIQVQKGVSIQANVNPANAFNSDFFGVVQKIQDSMQNNDPASLNGLLSQLDDVTNSLQAENADVGARSNMVDLVSTRLGTEETNTNQGLSDSVNADVAKAMVDFTTQQSAYQAALSMGAKIIQPTLMDYLK